MTGSRREVEAAAAIHPGRIRLPDWYERLVAWFTDEWWFLR